METVCHPSLDAISVRVTSSLVGTGRIAIELRFPYGTGQITAADWTKPDAHTTTLSQPGPGEARFARRLDGDAYDVSAQLGASRTPHRGRAAHVRARSRGGDADNSGSRRPSRLRPSRGPFLRSKTRAPRRGRTGTASGRPAAPSISPAAPIRDGGNWNAASSVAVPDGHPVAPAGFRRRNRG